MFGFVWLVCMVCVFVLSGFFCVFFIFVYLCFSGECVCMVWCLNFFNAFIYQHAPLPFVNTTCIFLNFTYYELS